MERMRGVGSKDSGMLFESALPPLSKWCAWKYAEELTCIALILGIALYLLRNWLYHRKLRKLTEGMNWMSSVITPQYFPGSGNFCIFGTCINVLKPSDQDQSNALIICACLLILYMLIMLWKSFMIGLVGRQMHNAIIVGVILICTVQEAHNSATTYPLLFGSPSTDTVEFLFNWACSAGSYLLTTYCLGLLETTESAESVRQ